MKLTRRGYIKASAAASAVAAAGLGAEAKAANLITEADKTGLSWNKAP